MKTSKFLALSFLAVLFSFSACDNMPEPDYWADQNPYTTLYSESFGTAATGTPWPLISEYEGLDKSGKGAEKVTLSAEGTVSVRSNSPSTGTANIPGYSGASGACNAMMAGAGASLLINDIAVCGAKNLTLSFGSNQTNSILTVAYKINGKAEWTDIKYEKTTAEWGMVDTLSITLPAGTNTIKLKFTAGTTQFGTRVDDIKLATNDPTGNPVVDPDETPAVPEPDPVTKLTEDFEGFADGGGDMYFGKQTDAKGWKGYKIQGTLEPDVRYFTTTNNKYVQFSAHRTSITTQDVQEMWLVSPRIDISAATGKFVSFNTVGGYFNDNTIFEVYVLAGDNPATDTKTKLEGWRLASKSDLSSGASYTAFIPSGNIDLSAFSGIIRIAFYYKGTSGSGNSTTYQLDNFAVGESFSVFTVAPQSLSFAKEGGEKTFTVTSDKEWTATSSNQTDFSVSVNGNTVTVTAAANTAAAQRSATITVKTADGLQEKPVNITQAGQGATGDAVFTETFAKIAGTAWSAGNSVLSDYSSFDNAGWTGDKVYPAGGVIKLGTSGAVGSVTTPSIDLSAKDGVFTLEFKTLVWWNDTKKIKVYVNDTMHETDEIAHYDKNNPVPPQTVTMTLSGGTAATKIKFESYQADKGRFYLDEVKILQ
jgi:hypothetical protein